METCVYTNQGGRPNNEDYAAYRTGSGDTGVWALADGVGGHDCGEVASRLAVEFVLAASEMVGDFSEPSLLKIMRAANDVILRKQSGDPALKAMRTTIVAAFLEGGRLTYFNVGDSRFYYFKNGRLAVQSQDHSVSQMAVNFGEITRSQIRFSGNRKKLLKVLGNGEDLDISRVEPSIPVEKGDSLLLCSDGFWEYVYETEMEIDLLKSSTPKEWMEYMVIRLLGRVKDNFDDLTAIGVFF